MIPIKGNKFVCTGGAGFIGSHLAEEIVRQGNQVVCVDNFSAGSKKNFSSWWAYNLCTIVYADVSEDKIDNYFDGVDVVFNNMAAKCTICREDPLKDLMVNAYGSFRVFKAAQKAGAKVIHASTGSVYGESGYQREDNQYAPRSFYGVSKLAGEQYLRCFEGLRWVGLRYFHVFGPRQDSSEKGGVIPIFITKMLNKEPVTVFGDGEQTRSFTYVKDVVKANFLAANSDMMEGEYYNVASGVKITLNMLIEMLSEIMNVKPEVRYEKERSGDIWEFNVDNTKIADDGMDEWTSFEDGLKETVEWYATQT